ncbi:phosphopantetheine-binding protein [Streptomyces sp. NPDC020983]|uniref:phosphopantetheine-binding protein n=1 Tax=Streptomyces sp. NPDC020983 TaxID=3365106 RepID=UPI00379B1D58
MSDTADLVSVVTGAVRRCAKLLEPGDEVHPDQPLLELGLDSPGLVELIVLLEEELDILIPDDQLTPEVFESVSSIVRALGPLVDGDA